MKTCAIKGCSNPLNPIRYDCTCGCGKSWCSDHGSKRSLFETPYLVRVDTREAK